MSTLKNSLQGREADPKVLKEMLKECPDKLNFTHFLTLFGEKLHGNRAVVFFVLV